MYKYRINDLLSHLPMKDYRKALKVIPKVLSVSLNTFSNYRRIRLHEKQDIPHQKVLMLEKVFNVEKGQLENFKIEDIELLKLLKECQE